MLLKSRPIISDFVGLRSDLAIQIIQLTGQRYPLGADDDTIKVTTLFRVDNIARKDIVANVCAVKYRYVRERGAPGSVTKPNVSVRGEKLYLWRVYTSERCTADNKI